MALTRCNVLTALFVACASLLYASESMAEDQGSNCDLALVLADDASGSMQEHEFQFVRDGYATAFSDQEVIQAITSGLYGCIWITQVQGSDIGQVAQAIPWTRISSAAEAKAFAEQMEGVKRYFAGPNEGKLTCVGCRMSLALRLFQSPQVSGSTKFVIDVSGDGQLDDTELARAARDKAVAQRITINALAVKSSQNPHSGTTTQKYEKDAVGGPDHFVMYAEEGYEKFGEAIQRKLVLEIAGWTPKHILTLLASSR